MKQLVSTAIPGFFRGLSMPLRGIGFVFRNPSLARIWIVPVLIVVALLIGGCITSGQVAAVLADRFAPTAAADADMGHQITGAIGHGLARGVFVLIGVALSLLLSIILAPVVAAPFNDMLGEEVERIELGRDPPPFSWARLGRDLGRTVRLELAKLALYALVVLPLWGVGFLVPPLGFAASVLGFVLTAAYFALDYVDGPLTRRSVGVKRRFRMLVRHPAPMLGFGLGVWVLLFVPLLNLFFMPAAVAGGTRLCSELGLLREAEAESPAADAPA